VALSPRFYALVAKLVWNRGRRGNYRARKAVRRQ